MAAAQRSESEVPSDREIIQERVFDAPRDLVWRAWTDPKHVDQWWGPNGFRNQTFAMDFRVGGTWTYVMHGPDGKVWPNWIRYEEIQKPERLVYAHGGEAGEPAHFHVTVTFTEVGGKTRVVMRSVFPNAEAVLAAKKFGAVEGGRQTLARLAGHLPYLADGSAEGRMVLTRLYDAPPQKVFAAWTTKDALERWWGPRGMTTEVGEFDFREGGAYRMTMRDANGAYPFHGVFGQIVPNARIEMRSVIDDLPDQEIRTIVTFTAEEGRTRLTVRQDIPKDEAAAKGQFEGWSGMLEKIAAGLA